MTKKITGTEGDLYLSIAIKQGDKEAFGSIYDKYAPVLMGLINRIMPADNDGEEILQTAFLHIWDQISSFDASKSSFLTWLIKITRRLALDKVNSLPAENHSYDNFVYIHANKNDLEQTVLGSVEIGIFNFVYYKGLSCTEAATALKMSVEDVKKNIRLAIKNMNVNVV
jgi:RNA polymerase sigma factor (sigma-70 family)